MGMGHAHGHDGHDHGPGDDRPHCDQPAADCVGPQAAFDRRRRERRGLTISLVVTGTIFFAELIGGWISGSLALQADAGHMFADVVALSIALAGIAIASRPRDDRRTWGWYRLEILSALANGVLLGVVAVVIVREAWERFLDPPVIDVKPMIIVAIFGLMANIVTISLLSRNRGSLALRGAFLHALGDTISSLGVIAGAIVIITTGELWVDAALSVGIALLIVYNAWGLVKEAVDVLLEGSPLGFEIEKVRAAIAEIPGVKDVHDIHLWTITSGMFAFSCHIAVRDGTTEGERDAILTRAKTLLHDRFAIDHSTIQIEGESFQEIGLVH